MGPIEEEIDGDRETVLIKDENDDIDEAMVRYKQ